MPLAKSAVRPVDEEISNIVKQSPPASGTLNKNDLSMVSSEFYRFFNITPMSSDFQQVKDVHDWAAEGSKSIADILHKVKSLEIKLGQPADGETRLSKLSNWVRINNTLKDTNMSFKQEMDSIRGRYANQLEQIKNNKQDKIYKLNAEIERIEKDYREAYSTTRARSMAEMTKIKDEYAKQLKELRQMEAVYHK